MQGVVKGGLNDTGNNIKSIQSGEYTLGASTTSANITINEVNANKSKVKITLYMNGSSDINRIAVIGKLTSGTNLNLERALDGVAVIVAWEVTEYYNVKSLQTGTASGTSQPTNITLSTVDKSKCLVECSFKSTKAESTISYATMNYLLTSNTNLQIRTAGGAYDAYYYQVVEFY